MTAPHPLPASARRSSRSGPTSAIGGGRGHFRSEGQRQDVGLSAHNQPFISGLSFHSQSSQSTTTLPRPVRRRGAFRFGDTVRFETEAEPSDPIGVSLQNLSFHDATHPRPAQPRRGFSYLSTLTSGHPQSPRSPSGRSQRLSVRRQMMVRATCVERPGLSVQ
jgi:hypothetical protein